MKQHNAPDGSKFWVNESGYMTNKDWVIAAQQLSKGTHAMPVVRDYPQWWFVLTCDRFGSHVNVPEALQVFTDHKIML
eukprot:5335236-Ditylum_brightwellii.AAC.1